MKILRKIVKILVNSIIILFELSLAFIFGLVFYILIVSRVSPPPTPDFECPQRVQVSENHYKIGENYLKKNAFGIWEMYIEGDAYERGVIYGQLSKELCQKQEQIFVDQINNFVPNKVLQQVLKLLLGYFNKDITKNIPLEYQQEIYGVSQSFSDEYDYIAPKYMRILNYHAAHDIGHALNDYSMVGCSSFAVKGEKSGDHQLMAGRNFDFYVGDEFAKDKLLLFVNPSKGYAFCSYSWAGFMGVASGMNEKGLSVTINASKSDLPTGTKTPVSLLAREILQYARNIEEAIEIAKKRELFVSETIMVGSREDNSVVLIEKSPTKMGVRYMNTDQIICTNHYQSDTFKKDPANLDNIKNSDSKYRYDRITQLLAANDSLSESQVAAVLRDQNGLNGDTLGLANPKALNQLIAHHSCIFKYDRPQFYVSTNNWQLGEYLGYDILSSLKKKQLVVSDTIPADIFLTTDAFQSVKSFKSYKKKIDAYLHFDKALKLSEKEVQSFIQSNGESYLTYEILGRYYLKRGELSEAKEMLSVALSKELPSIQVRNELTELKESIK